MRALAGDLSRREALRRVGSGLAGAAVGTLIREPVWPADLAEVAQGMYSLRLRVERSDEWVKQEVG